MSFSLAFWIILLLWVLLSGWGHYRGMGDRLAWVDNLLLFLLFLIVGWKLFGAPLHG